MPDGTVLAVAGSGDVDELTSAEYYDPSTGLWTLVGSVLRARAGHTATLLPDGRVLIAGGGEVGSVTSAAELYDPGTESWTTAAPLSLARIDHTATLLRDGRVLVVGGSDKFISNTSTELYDPATGAWSTGPDYGRRQGRTHGDPAARRQGARDRGQAGTRGGLVSRDLRSGVQHVDARRRRCPLNAVSIPPPCMPGGGIHGHRRKGRQRHPRLHRDPRSPLSRG